MQYTDGKSVMGPDTIREGVAVWFQNNQGRWTCLKNKSPEFLATQSRFKDKPDFVDIEDES